MMPKLDIQVAINDEGDDTMTRDDCAAGVYLCDALDDLPDLLKALDKEAECGTRCVVVEVGDYTESGGCNITSITVDLETGRRIAKAVEQIIRERIKELGITHPPEAT